VFQRVFLQLVNNAARFHPVNQYAVVCTLVFDFSISETSTLSSQPKHYRQLEASSFPISEFSASSHRNLLALSSYPFSKKISRNPRSRYPSQRPVRDRKAPKSFLRNLSGLPLRSFIAYFLSPHPFLHFSEQF